MLSPPVQPRHHEHASASSAQTPKELLDNLYALVADAKKLLGEAVSEHTEEAMGALRERFDAAQERLGEFYDDARTKVSDRPRNRG